MGAHACTTYMLMRRQIARFYSSSPALIGSTEENDSWRQPLPLPEPQMKEAETMAYRILLVEDDSASGTEQVAPPKGDRGAKNLWALD